MSSTRPILDHEAFADPMAKFAWRTVQVYPRRPLPPVLGIILSGIATWAVIFGIGAMIWSMGNG